MQEIWNRLIGKNNDQLINHLEFFLQEKWERLDWSISLEILSKIKWPLWYSDTEKSISVVEHSGYKKIK